MSIREFKRRNALGSLLFSRSFITFLGVLVVLLSGALLSWSNFVSAKKELESGLMLQAGLLVSGLNSNRIKTLGGDIEDLSLPEYRRIKEQFQQTRAVFPDYRFIYLMGRNDKREIYFIVDSEPFGSADESLPGDIYLEASEVDHRVFDDAKPLITPVTTDSWGTWVSVLVPVMDRSSGTVVAVLGIDVDVKDRNSYLARHLVKPIAFTCILLFLIFVSYRLVVRKNTLDSESKKSWFPRNIEILVFLMFSLSITVMAAITTHDRQQTTRKEAFANLSTRSALSVIDTIKDMRDMELEGISLLYESSQVVERREFAHYARALIDSRYLAILGWSPVVSAPERQRFEQFIREEGLPDFSVWEENAAGERTSVNRAVSYPVVYLEPSERYSKVLGYDLASSSLILEAIEESLSTGLSTVSDPMEFQDDTGKSNRLFVFRPVMEEGREEFTGLVFTLIQPEMLLNEFYSIAKVSVFSMVLGIYQLGKDGQPFLLVTSATEEHSVELANTEIRHYHNSDLNVIFPLFAFGRTFMIVTHPGRDFDRIYPLHNGFFILVIGLIITASVASIISTVNGRSVLLEREVGEKTRQIRESLDRVTQTMEGSIAILASAIELRDPYTAGHQKRVSTLAVAIGEKMGLDSDRIRGLRMAALIHDVGKMQVPAEILTTPRKLSELEYSMIKMHPEVGYALLKEIEFPWPVAEMILQHHERLDGSGYPSGLSGDDIMLEARIIGAADVVEAMTSHRPYRPAFDLEAVIEEIEKNADVLYDREVVKALISVFEEGFSFDVT